MEALFYEKLPDGAVLCKLCPQLCRIKRGSRGFCRVRKNVDGTLETTNYGRISAYHLDPTEKKPLYHFYPGSYLFSLGTVGCNFRCGFCQNWTIAHLDAPTEELLPAEAVRLAEEYCKKVPECVGIAYTYTEPSVWYEYVLETARLAKQKNLHNVLVTNGYINEEPLRQLLPYIDAMNIDVKSFREEFYRKVCVGHRDPVLKTVKIAYDLGVHVEVTTLLIPTLNDNDGELEDLTDWLASVGPEIPLHFSRYHPDYKMDLPPTPLETMKRAREIATRKLRYVYLGNVHDVQGNNTYCPNCGAVVIRRSGMGVVGSNLKGKNCASCGQPVDIRGEVVGIEKR